METITDVLIKKVELEKEMEVCFKRLDEIWLIKIGLRSLWRQDWFYNLEESFIKTKLEAINQEISKLSKKEIVWFNWEVI